MLKNKRTLVILAIFLAGFISFLIIKQFGMIKFAHVFNKDLEFIKKDYPGNIMIGGMFVNGHVVDQPPYKKLLNWILSRNPQKEEKANDPFRVQVITDTSFLHNKKDVIVWLGHSTFYIRINNVSMVTDPCLGDIPFKKRLHGQPFSPSLLTGLDYILVSHGHRDHLDKNTVRQLISTNPQVTFLAPLKMGRVLKRFGAKHIQEAGWYQRYDTPKGVEVNFLPARHWHKRGMYDYNSILWGSFMIKHGDKSIYFAGDTGYGRHFKEIQEIIPEVNIVMMPIGAYSPPEMMEASHINPEEAAQAFNEMHGKEFIPMHYGTFDLSDEPLGEPIRKMEGLNRDSILKGGLRILGAGEVYFF